MEKVDKEFIHIAIYVDDFIVFQFSRNDKVIGSIKKERTESNIFLGLEIKKIEENITLSQRNYVKKNLI